MQEMSGTAGISICPRCGAGFTCGVQAGQGRCWCLELPAIPPPDAGAAACYCPDCLRALIAASSAGERD